MRIFLTNSLSLNGFDTFLRSFDANDPGVLTIETDPAGVRNVHPAVLALTAAFARNVDPEHMTTNAVTAESGRHLARMRLCDFLGRTSSRDCDFDDPESADRCIPLTAIANSEEQLRYINERIPRLGLPDKTANAVEYMVSELVRNVLEHAAAPGGAMVAVRYHDQSHTVSIGICDTGIGIRTAIRQSWPATSDVDAIRQALAPGITGTTRHVGGTAVNAGTGLFFAKSVVRAAQGYFLLYSGTGIIKELPQSCVDFTSESHTEKTNDAPSLAGTLVSVDLPLHETIEFSSLLKMIRQAYMGAVRERKERKYHKPKFT